MNQQQFFSPDFYLSQEPTRTFTPAHVLPSIVIPLNGLDIRFINAISDLMEWSSIIQGDLQNILFVTNECFNQIGDLIDHSQINFLYKLQGNMDEKGNVPGYPSPIHLQNTMVTHPDIWPRFVTLFRHFALEFQAYINLYLHNLRSKELIFQKWVQNGFVFLLAERTREYPIDGI